MGIYDRDYISEEREERFIKIEKVHTEIWVQLENQQKMLDQLFDLIKLLRQERKDLLQRIEELEKTQEVLLKEIEKLKGLIGD
jgi:chromosome segregation ATPase